MRTVLFGTLFRLERIPLEVNPLAEYRQIGVRSFGRGVFYRVPVPGTDLSKLDYFHIKPDRIVFSNIMAWEGAVGITGPEAEGAVGSQRFLSYVAMTDDVDLRYVNYFFQSEVGAGLLRRGSTGTVKRNQMLSPRTIEAFKIPLPPVAEQLSIAARLDRAAYVLGYVDQLRTLGEAMRQSVLNSAFSGEL